MEGTCGGRDGKSALVSIVMPVRDVADTLGEAVESIFLQTWSEWELLVVNDGSQDGTSGILANYAARDPRVRILSTPRRGIVVALQTGCAAAAGDWIARMDGDDVMHPERLRWQMDYVRENPRCGVVSGRVRYGGGTSGYAAHVAWVNSLGTHEEMSLRRFVEAPVAHPSVMFRRCLLEKHGGYRDGGFPEDYELWLRWMGAGVRFGKVSEEILVWNDPPSRLSRTDPRYGVDRFYQIKCEYLAQWLRRNVDSSRALWLWGAGRVTRRRFDFLESAGCRFQGFIDVDPKKASVHRDGRRVVMADDLPERERAFLVVGVANRGARAEIVAHLTARGWREGLDFLLAA